MTKAAFRALFFCAVTATLLSGSGATLVKSRNEDIASTMASNGMHRISQVCRSCHLYRTLWRWWWWLCMKIATTVNEPHRSAVITYIRMHRNTTTCVLDGWSGQKITRVRIDFLIWCCVSFRTVCVSLVWSFWDQDSQSLFVKYYVRHHHDHPLQTEAFQSTNLLTNCISYILDLCRRCKDSEAVKRHPPDWCYNHCGWYWVLWI